MQAGISTQSETSFLRDRVRELEDNLSALEVPASLYCPCCRDSRRNLYRKIVGGVEKMVMILPMQLFNMLIEIHKEANVAQS